MEKLKLNSFTKRSLTSLVLVSLGFGIIYVGAPLIEMAALLIGVLLAWEWCNAVPNNNKTLYLNSYIYALVACLAFPSYWSIGVVVLATAFVWLKAKGEAKRKLLTLGVAYIAVGVSSVVWIYQAAGIWTLLWILFVVWGMDIGGYVVGCTLKGPKLMPKISPNKTWAGLFGGLVFSALFSSLLIFAFDSFSRESALQFVDYDQYMADLKNIYISTAILAMIFGFVSQVGDFVESAIKRNIGIKDFSNLIPGHGGVFDRFDALIFAAPILYVTIIVWSQFLS